MPNKVRHLRGRDEEWAANDVVIDDGEIALALSPAGNYRMKIGNGEKKFSELDMFGGEVRKPSGQIVTLKHCDDVRYKAVTQLNIEFPALRDEDYYSLLTFDSPESPTKLSYPDDVTFTGKSIADGRFVPEPKLHYTVIFWEDGSGIQCHVRGLENA